MARIRGFLQAFRRIARRPSGAAGRAAEIRDAMNE
jgi:hypothetical protein